MFDVTSYELVLNGASVGLVAGCGAVLWGLVADRAAGRLRVVAASAGAVALVISGAVGFSNPFDSPVELYEAWMAEEYGVSLTEEEDDWTGWREFMDGETVEVVDADGDVFIVEKHGDVEEPVLVNVVTGEELAVSDEGVVR